MNLAIWGILETVTNWSLDLLFSDDCHLQLYVDIVIGDSFYQYLLSELNFQLSSEI